MKRILIVPGSARSQALSKRLTDELIRDIVPALWHFAGRWGQIGPEGRIVALPNVTRELALIKVAATANNRSRIFELAEVFRARIVDLAPDSLMIEITGVESKIEGLIQVLNETEDRVLEVCRSGKMTMRRGKHSKGVLRAMGAGEPEIPTPGNLPLDTGHDNFADNI